MGVSTCHAIIAYVSAAPDVARFFNHTEGNMGWFRNNRPKYESTEFIRDVRWSIVTRGDEWRIIESFDLDGDRMGDQLEHKPSGIRLRVYATQGKSHGMTYMTNPYFPATADESADLFAAVRIWVANQLKASRKEPNVCNSRPTVRLEDQCCTCDCQEQSRVDAGWGRGG